MNSIKGFQNINKIQPRGLPNSNPRTENGSGPSFKEALNGVKPTPHRELIRAELAETTSKIQFSNHAVDRMRLRGIQYSPDQLQKIESAINKASAKGAKETLIIAGDSAMIVNVKDNKVVTVMDKNMLKDNVFTNIDSTVVI